MRKWLGLDCFHPVEIALCALAVAVALVVLAVLPAPRTATAGPPPATGGCITQNQSTGVYTNNCAFGLQAYTVTGLPTCNAAAKLLRAAVTDATSPTYNGALTGGGAVVVPVFCNGTAWTSH